MSELNEFMDRFRFVPKLAWCVGVERECFIVDHTGKVVPRAVDVLKSTVSSNGWSRTDIGYELSACQLETRAGPCDLKAMPLRLKLVREAVEYHLNLFGLAASHKEVAG